jgi:hypothetical protein
MAVTPLATEYPLVPEMTRIRVSPKRTIEGYTDEPIDHLLRMGYLGGLVDQAFSLSSPSGGTSPRRASRRLERAYERTMRAVVGLSRASITTSTKPSSVLIRPISM